ncbi:hypothetical protein [Stenotrophomonas maltophilia]|uniref:hypothetical protein n=1 Tax=Stenotrophomonas maltophilia TaxID=40324 RepID=UPI002E79FF64|nr:hypothetical protein [Stenotrophomonas maltophilia]
MADWVAAVVAAAGAVAVVFVTRAANNTARASHELARQLKDRDEEIRSRDRAVLGALVYGEVLRASQHYADLHAALQKVGAFDWAVQSVTNLDTLQSEAAGPDISRLRQEVHRFNLLPAYAGQQLAMAIGVTQLCGENAAKLRAANDRLTQQRWFQSLVTAVEGAARAFTAAHIHLHEAMKAEEN